MCSPGGLGGAVVRRGDVVVGALVAVNPSGDIDDGTIPEAIGEGTFDAWPTEPDSPFTNTTIAAVVTNARLDKLGCLLVSQGGHDGYARALFPSHTRERRRRRGHCRPRSGRCAGGHRAHAGGGGGREGGAIGSVDGCSSRPRPHR